jgi:hypothetical protein
VPGDVGVVVVVDVDMWTCWSPIFAIILAKYFVFIFVIYWIPSTVRK